MSKKSKRFLSAIITLSMMITVLFAGVPAGAVSKQVTKKIATNATINTKSVLDALAKAKADAAVKTKALVAEKAKAIAAKKASDMAIVKAREAGKVSGLKEAQNLAEAAAKASAEAEEASKHAKNVIFLLGDGMNSTEVTLTRWYKNAKLSLDDIYTGSISTYNSNSIITDSAPAVTALATGYKSDSGYISVYPSDITVPTVETVDAKDAYKPLATILEEAKLYGKATGIIATSQIQHATPAGFTAHTYNRNDYLDIAKQQVYQNLDVVLGGGKEYLIPFDVFNKTDTSGNLLGRKDGINLLDEIKSLGYTYVEDTESMKNAIGNKLWGMFSDQGMSYDFDRNPVKEPSLTEMTNKAIDVLSKDKDGFFLFVEGSQIDWASHANDPIGVISDSLAYDKAVGVALDFARKDKNTLVIAVTDHGCGGMTIGSQKTNSGYDKLQLNVLIDPLKKATLTGAGLESKLYSELTADMSNLKDIVKKYYGIDNLTQDEVNQISAYIKAKKAGSLNYIVGPMMTTRSAIGWTTTGHTGEDVSMYAYGPGKPTGLIDNTHMAKIVSDSMGLSLDDANKELYTNIEDSIGYIPGATASIDNTDPLNVVLVIETAKVKAELPMSTNKVIINGTAKYAVGLNLLTRSGAVYVSWDALDIVKAAQ